MIKRKIPQDIFRVFPCSMVTVGTAIGALPPVPTGLHDSGYLSLDAMNRYVRSLLPVEKAVNFRRGERPSLKEFLEGNEGRRAVICVMGHYLFADGKTYWSFLRNAKDPVVQVWYLKEAGA